MSYFTIFTAANDQDLRARVTACVVQENWTNPEGAVSQIMWDFVAQSDVEAAYASAVAADNPFPGRDEAVVTDGMILSFVQANPQS